MSVVQTASSLIEEHGVSLLENPLRLEAYLKDLHPDDERDVFLICEAHFAGFVDRLRQEVQMSESKRQRLALDFVACCGVAIVFASWTIQAWTEILPSWAYEKKRRKQYLGTLDEVLRGINDDKTG